MYTLRKSQGKNVSFCNQEESEYVDRSNMDF